MNANGMIEPGDCVTAGVSGGADSVCMLHLLTRLQKEIPFRLAAVHVNHGMRAEAGRTPSSWKGCVNSGAFPSICGKWIWRAMRRRINCLRRRRGVCSATGRFRRFSGR